jgi:hypothetical protein
MMSNWKIGGVGFIFVLRGSILYPGVSIETKLLVDCLQDITVNKGR